jgi:hypothetical protein
MKKKGVIMGFLALFWFFSLFQTFFFVNASSVERYTPNEIVVFALEICPLCPQDKEEWEFQQKYLLDLENELDPKEFDVTYLVGFADYQALTNSYEVINVSSSIRTMDMIVNIDGLFVFISYVPVEIIKEFLQEYASAYSRFILAKDTLHPKEYRIIEGDSEEIRIVTIEESLEEVINRPTDPKEPSFLSTPMGMIVTILSLGIVLSFIVIIVKRKRSIN